MAPVPATAISQTAVVSTSTTSAVNGVSSSVSNPQLSKGKNGSTKRIEIDNLVVDFQKKLGKDWDGYQIAVSLFLVGKLSRTELMQQLDQILDKSTYRMHNQLLLATLTNSFRDEPQDGILSAGFGNQHTLQHKKRKTSNKSSQYELLKKDVLSLSIRERKRLKNIKRESGKKGMINSIISMTRQAIVPKVPIVTNIENGNVGQTSQWGQEILDSLQMPLCAEAYELPDKNHLKTRITGIAREHGLIGTINDKVPEVLTLSLEYHLKSIIESAMDMIKFRGSRSSSNGGSESSSSINISNASRKRKTITLTIEDLYDTLESSPHLVEPCGPTYSLPFNKLRNDDDVQLLEEQRYYFQQPKGTSNGANSNRSPTKFSKISYLLPTKEKAQPKVSPSTTTAVAEDSPKTEGSDDKKPNAGSTDLNGSGSQDAEITESKKDTTATSKDAANDTSTAAAVNATVTAATTITNTDAEATNSTVSTNGTAKATIAIPQPNLALSDANIGPPEELNLLINDLLGI